MMEFDVYYMKPSFFRDGIMGYDWCKSRNILPRPIALGETHVHLKTVQALDLNKLYAEMQSHNWSPNGEARPLIVERGLQHTSMSVGDIVVTSDGRVFMVDNTGWKQLDV